MKQIFDGMRGEAQEKIMPKGSVSKTEMLIKSSCYGKVLALIDEAEAKWEADCCEWEYNDVEEKWETSCGVLFKLHDSEREITNFCSCCGKKIKVVE